MPSGQKDTLLPLVYWLTLAGRHQSRDYFQMRGFGVLSFSKESAAFKRLIFSRKMLGYLSRPLEGLLKRDKWLN